MLAPEHCRGCGAPLVDGAAPVCPVCVGELFSALPSELDVGAGARGVRNGEVDGCSCCGRELLAEQGICTRCRDADLSLRGHRTLGAYRGLLRTLVKDFKASGDRRLARLFAQRAALVVRAAERQDAVICPVPARPNARRERGFDPALRFAQELAGELDMKLERLLLRPTGVPQKQRNRQERLADPIPGLSLSESGRAFACRTGRTQAALLIDDVFTTGATLDRCSRVLLEAGIETVGAISVARD